MLALAYSLFAVLAGWLEAILYARRAAETFDSNEHGGMSYQRVAVLLVGAAAVCRYAWGGPWLLLAEVIPTALLFPMVHDEAYNFTRLWIDWKGGNTPEKLLGDGEAFREARKEYRYGYQSPTTTARNDFNGQERTWLAIAGAVLLLALYLLPFFHLFPFNK